jgi:hypothetical protein
MVAHVTNKRDVVVDLLKSENMARVNPSWINRSI